MIERRVTQLLPTAGLAVVCAAVGLAWGVEPALSPRGWLGRLIVLRVGGLLALAALRITMIQPSKSARGARQYIESLCSLELHALSENEPVESVPLRKEDHFWREACRQVRQRLAEFAHRSEELEM